MKLLPIYPHSRDRFAFRAERLDDEPAAWVWVADEYRVAWVTEHQAEMILEPGQPSPRYAHEMYFRELRREALPLAAPTGRPVNPIEPTNEKGAG